MTNRSSAMCAIALAIATMASLSSCATPAPIVPAEFVIPDFSGKTEKSVMDWLSAHDVIVTTTFDYGEAEGTACAEAGDGVVKAQSQSAGTKVVNVEQTRLVFDAYCSY